MIMYEYTQGMIHYSHHVYEYEIYESNSGMKTEHMSRTFKIVRDIFWSPLMQKICSLWITLIFFSRLPKTQKGAVGNQIWWIRTIIVIMTTLCVLALNYRQSEGAGGDCSSGHICLNLSLSFNSFFPV